jgi:hypothetical protein
MRVKYRFPVFLTSALLLANSVSAAADGDGARQDERAMDVLQSMSAYKTSLDSAIISGVTLTDARLGEGLMVANTDEVKVVIDRPGSLYISSFDGVQKKELYFHEGTLTVFDSAKKYYAQASIPDEIEDAMEFALEELEVEAPLMDMVYKDASIHLIDSRTTVMYLADKVRVAGTDCHQIAIRGPETDVQLWIEEGDQPVPRKIMITSNWEGGSPRFIANMKWESNPEVDRDTFLFRAPEGSTNIGFVQGSRSEGE